MVSSKTFVEAAEIFEKTASYISELETKLNNSEARVAELVKEAQTRHSKDEVAEPLSKLASSGFTEEEQEQLAGLGKDILEKLASHSDHPASMGSAYGTSAADMDPLTKFLLS